MNSASELKNPIEMVKKKIQASESINYHVRARIQAQITILVQDEHDTDPKNRTLTNSTFELKNPLEMVKNTIQAFKQLNSDVLARIQAQITTLVPHEQETNKKNRTSTNLAFDLTNPLEIVKKK